MSGKIEDAGPGFGLVALLILVAVFASGCGFTPEGQAIRLAVKEYGAIAADAELENLEWALCNGVSVGAVKRRYPPGAKKARGYSELCD